MTTATGLTFAVKTWEEKIYNEGEGLPPLTRAHVTNTYTGELQAEGVLEYLMVTNPAGVTTFIGLERITGTLGGRTGSFVAQHTGIYENGSASGTWTIIAGTGTGELTGVRGTATFGATHAETEHNTTFNYFFE